MSEALCALAELADPGAKGFEIERDGRRVRIFVVRRGRQVFGYVNSCPHVGVPLNKDEESARSALAGYDEIGFPIAKEPAASNAFRALINEFPVHEV